MFIGLITLCFNTGDQCAYVRTWTSNETLQNCVPAVLSLVRVPQSVTSPIQSHKPIRREGTIGNDGRSFNLSCFIPRRRHPCLLSCLPFCPSCPSYLSCLSCPFSLSFLSFSCLHPRPWEKQWMYWAGVINLTPTLWTYVDVLRHKMSLN